MPFQSWRYMRRHDHFFSLSVSLVPLTSILGEHELSRFRLTLALVRVSLVAVRNLHTMQLERYVFSFRRTSYSFINFVRYLRGLMILKWHPFPRGSNLISKLFDRFFWALAPSNLLSVDTSALREFSVALLWEIFSEYSRKEIIIVVIQALESRHEFDF